MTPAANCVRQKLQNRQIQIIERMSLKQHNDIVEKLLKKIDAKDSQIEGLRKQLKKVTANVNGIGMRPETSDNEKKLTKKMNQMQKEYKARIQTLNQQITSKNNENKDLKERLNTKKNQQAKQKQHIAQVLKKTAAMSSYDPKFAAVVSHYESQIEKKDKHIQNLQKQIKESYYSTNKQKEQNEDINDSNGRQNELVGPKILNDQHYHTQYQQEINTLKNEIAKYKRISDEKVKEFKDLNRRYSELTKDYYKILNEFGQKQPIKITPLSAGIQKKKTSKTGIQNILEEMLNCQNEEASQNDPSLSYSFMTNLSKMQGNQKIDNEDRQIAKQLQKATDILDSIMELIGVQFPSQILSALSKIQAKYQEMIVHENASRFLQSMLYRLGMGKIPTSQLIEEAEKLEIKINKLSEDSDLLSEICFQIGAKKDKVLDKLKDLKAVQEQFFSNMRDIKFMQQLPKANKIAEFIQYFQMDKQMCELPEQLKKMYEQLKYVEKFMKHANVILNRPNEGMGLQKTLQGILRFLQRKTAEESMQSVTKLKKGKKIAVQ